MFLVNGPQAIDVNPECPKCILAINVSPPNKKLVIASFSFYLEHKIGEGIGSSSKPVVIPKLLNNSQASCSLINIDFLVLNTAHFDKSTGFPFFGFANLNFLLCFLSTFQPIQLNCFIIRLKFHNCFKVICVEISKSL